MTKIKLNNMQLQEIINESVNRYINEAYNRKERERQVAQETLGTNSFEEFYRNTGFWVSAEAMHRMSEYFRVMAEKTQQMEQQPQ